MLFPGLCLNIETSICKYILHSESAPWKLPLWNQFTLNQNDRQWYNCALMPYCSDFVMSSFVLISQK